MTRWLFSLLVLLTASARSSVTFAAQGEVSALQQRLDKRVEGYEIPSHNFIDAAIRVARDFQVPMGIEWVDASSSKPLTTLSWKHVSVREILRSIASSQPGCELQVTGGVAHIVAPTLMRSDSDFLNLRVHQFEVNQVPVEMATRRLRDFVKSRVSPPRQGIRAGVGGSLGTNPDEPRVTMRLADVTVRDVLDKIALVSAKKIWIVTFLSDGRLTPTGFRRTVTLWNDSPIPEDEQPVWDMLHWTDELPTRAAESIR